MPKITIKGKTKEFPYTMKGMAAAKAAKRVEGKRKQRTSDGYMMMDKKSMLMK